MQGRRAGSNSESPQRLHAWGDLVSIRPNFDLDSKYWCATVARIVGDNLRGAPMNVMDRAFLYVGVLAIAVLAGVAIYQTFHAAKTFHAAEQIEAIGPIAGEDEQIEALGPIAGKAEEIEALKLSAGKGTAAPPEQIFVARLGSGLCYVSDSLPYLYSMPDPLVSHAIVWTTIGNNDSYTITFTTSPFESGDLQVKVPAGGSSDPEFIAAKPGDFKYTVQDDKTPCSGTITGFNAAPVWVHVSK